MAGRDVGLTGGEKSGPTAGRAGRQVAWKSERRERATGTGRHASTTAAAWQLLSVPVQGLPLQERALQRHQRQNAEADLPEERAYCWQKVRAYCWQKVRAYCWQEVRAYCWHKSRPTAGTRADLLLVGSM